MTNSFILSPALLLVIEAASAIVTKVASPTGRAKTAIDPPSALSASYRELSVPSNSTLPGKTHL